MAIGNMLARFGNQPSLMEGVEQGRRVRTLNDLGQFQLQQGQQQAQRQSQLSDLYQRFAQGDQSAMTEIAGVSPEVHMQLQQQMAARDEVQRKRAVEQATGIAQQILVARQNPQMQQQLAQTSGITPDMYDDVLARAAVIPKVYEMMTTDNRPDSVQKLQYLMDNPEAMAAEQGLRRAGGTNVTVGGKDPQFGAAPNNMVWGRNPDGSVAMRDDPSGFKAPVAVPISGGPIDREAAELEEKERLRQAGRARAGTTVIQDLQRALDIVQSNRLAVGAPSIVTKMIPESDAQAAEGFIQSALSNVGLDTLQAMRESSPTGGALGQVPIQQQKRLEQVLGSLDLSQRPDIVQDNLKRVINIYMDIVHGTPEEVAELERQGKIDPQRAQEIRQRHPLSFDDFGRPVNQEQQSPSPSDFNLPPGSKFLGFE